MEQEDDFLASKYIEYRKALNETKACSLLMPYGWLMSPQTIRLDTELGLQQMVYRGLADDAARDLANGINHLIDLTKRLEAWRSVIEGLDVQQTIQLMHEFVQDLASMALLSPYTLKARFNFAIAHLSHQANRVSQGENWTDDLAALPEDWGIHHEQADNAAKPWRSWKKLNKALNKVDMGDYKTATDDFRSKYTHRFTPRVELGLSQSVKRISSKGEETLSYGIGGTPPLKLETVVRELKTQCLGLSVCYAEFQKLVAEQSEALFADERLK
ncbi:hypothetical protein [Agrobacterium vitis]|uniref:hypothetical protein n=1 Tax=Agrobacterium vitis TaxID=373 RepID=UPI001571EF77|nr:hypothetical protein [Agrobacterium vitis]NSZ17881.1 hypothetical protein [Agrobacterium vitis]QZO03551.1 hypothetical protein K4831_14130 [Agrobacterium vitis]UJL88674.1 hypothetical protein AVF2S5_12470 [Agrobacterium vitis]